MRAATLIAVLALTGCAASPASLGITGPAPLSPPPAVDDSVIGQPGVPDTNGYGPSMVPSTGGGRYFNYN